MSYIVSHRANYEPSGFYNYPDKEFENLDDARKYYDNERNKCLKESEKHIKDYPQLYADQYMRDDLFRDYTEDVLDEWTLAGFIFHENYAYHIWQLEELYS